MGRQASFDSDRWQRVFQTLAAYPDPEQLRDVLIDRMQAARPCGGTAVRALKADLEATLALIVPEGSDRKTLYH